MLKCFIKLIGKRNSFRSLPLFKNCCVKILPRSESNSSAAGHSGVLTVNNKSCRKFSNSGLKSVSSLLLAHFLRKAVKNWTAVAMALSYLVLISTSRSMPSSGSKISRPSSSNIWKIISIIIDYPILMLVRKIHYKKIYYVNTIYPPVYNK